MYAHMYFPLFLCTVNHSFIPLFYLSLYPSLSLSHTHTHILSVEQTGLSPLVKGQWKNFLAVYAGFYVFNNIVRPIRFGVALGVSRYFENAVKWMEEKAKVSRPVAIGFVVFLANFCGTIAAMGFGISVAASFSGVPIFPPKV